MKRVLCAALLAVLVFGLRPVWAQPRLACQTIGQGPSEAVVCEYVATGVANYVAATPNPWRITVLRVENGQEQTVTLASSTGEPVARGGLRTFAGEHVTVTLGASCFEPSPACGTAGAILVVEG